MNNNTILTKKAACCLGAVFLCGTVLTGCEEAHKSADSKNLLFALLLAGSSNTATTNSSGLGDRTDYNSTSLTSRTYLSMSDTETLQKYSITSSSSDIPAVKVASGGNLTISNSKINKSGATASEDNSNFYGINAGVLASSSSSAASYTSSTASAITMTDCTISTASAGSNGIFAFGENAAVVLDHVTITTTGNSSRGVDATYGGSVTISNSLITTSGSHCAALATDRYGSASAPKITATNCSGTTAGDGSPGIYCTGTFNVTGCTLTATGSEAAVIEGLNSITLNNSSITGNAKWGVMIYQSNSGDSSVGQGTFTMTGGTLTNQYASGPAFFVCNTTAVITLTGATIANSSGTLLKAMAPTGSDNTNTSWGTLGGTVTFKATDQTLAGSIVLDSSSSLAMTLATSSGSSNATALTGAVNTANTAKSVALTLDSASSWTASAVSYLTSLTDADTTYSNIQSAYNIYVNGATTGDYTTSKSLSGGGTLYIK